MHFARLICVFSFFHYNISPVLDYSPVRRPISSDISVTRQKHQQPSKIIISLHNIIAIPCALAICEIKQTRQPHSFANHSRTITCPLLRTDDQLRLNYCFTGTTHIICSRQSVKLSNGCNLENPMNLNELNAGQIRLVFMLLSPLTGRVLLLLLHYYYDCGGVGRIII